MALDFEKPLLELEAKINELKHFTNEKGIDFTDEIVLLEKKAREMKENIYSQLTPWQKVQIARHPARPNTLDYIKALFTDFYEMHGDRFYGDDPAIIGGIARYKGMPVTVMGHLKGHDTKENVTRNFGMAHPEGFRKSLRLMKQAEKFKRPVICFIDTAGAYCGMGAEERGQGEAIARNLMGMSALKTPVVSIVIGEGGSGGALALGVANRILIQEHAIFSVSSPESAASILWKDGTRAREAAEVLKLTAQDLKGFGIIDEIVPEPLGGAHSDLAKAYKLVDEALERNLQQVLGSPVDELLEARYKKFRNLGQFG
ncbi:acetyl-CoA carboxylase carboxyltransferase subunit alpha [Desulforamulus ruminis]|uniref:Acetyl-coenzyme A carboxylase carboxyl transferase subunit alpha n=1 Tax=Desulforamulus ruminis (strain ATCC 23193 / DSM 2154 / NCIMB 8452 / DL) TaxID=696281 RepID=F6DPP9_DESRL|nr:acetyl-CoA carboxylase carboxyltransferase subunit alpha [Desulforamulus ruminis]AEG59626.1 acetyl-CoA carboxylase, carboxyl transferase, alpha subunit [Desulforamulus ruminis DSM 2154]